MGESKRSLIKEYYFSDEELSHENGSYDGTQKKFFHDGYWYKYDLRGYEGKAEYLASRVMQCSDISNYVEYDECLINGHQGCKSEHFQKDNEVYCTFEELYKMSKGRSLTNEIMVIQDCSERIEFFCDFVKEETDINYMPFLSKLLCLDMILLNTDRHFNNFGVIYDSVKESYSPAPVFDNGACLLSDVVTFNSHKLENDIASVIGMPFAANLELQSYYAGFNLHLDYRKLERILQQEAECRALQVLKVQLERYKTVIKDVNG